MSEVVPLIQLSDEQAQLAQTLTNQTLNQLSQNPLIQGTLVQGVELSSGPNNRVQHKLARVPRGYFITKSTASVGVFLVSATSRELVLNASASATVDLWVF